MSISNRSLIPPHNSPYFKGNLMLQSRESNNTNHQKSKELPRISNKNKTLLLTNSKAKSSNSPSPKTSKSEVLLKFNKIKKHLNTV